MKTPLESAAMLDRGGRPTVRDLLDRLVFDPMEGTLRLDGERLVMQRAATAVDLRRELLRFLGPVETRVFLIRQGFLSGQSDARFIREAWPGLDIGDAFTAGTRLHMFSGTVRVETVHNDFDFRRKRFSAEFLWHNSLEAAFFGKGQMGAEPVCWSQIGYASGYASEFFGTLIVYKETACAAGGHKACRVVGKPAEAWGANDPEVALFRERIVRPIETTLPRLAASFRVAEPPSDGLDRILLAPVQERLGNVAASSLPALILGAPGAGRWRAACHLHRLSGGTGEPRRIAAAAITSDLLDDLSGFSRAAGRKGAGVETLVVDDIEEMPHAMQSRLVAALEGGGMAGLPRFVALSSWTPGRLARDPAVRRELWLALAVAPIEMPALADRPGDRLALAEALLPGLARRVGRTEASLDPEAARFIADSPWPGNLPEMRAVLMAVLAARAPSGPIGSQEIAVQQARLSDPPKARDDLPSWLGAALDAGGLSMEALEREVYAAATARTGGNLSAAARLLGLSRAQLAYRLNAKVGQPTPEGGA
jgi:activator of aromatic catabolism/V4R domain-containing protein/regulatory Fis family protein/sigma-54-interacting transcriptional regulator